MNLRSSIIQTPLAYLAGQFRRLHNSLPPPMPSINNLIFLLEIHLTFRQKIISLPGRFNEKIIKGDISRACSPSESELIVA
jgi:hypothetical protein